MDNVLSDQLKCSDAVTLTNAKHAFSESLGEYAILGALYFAKRVPTCLRQYHARSFEKYEVGMLRGYVPGEPDRPRTCDLHGICSHVDGIVLVYFT